ncbi:MAG: histidinol dehydrogenase [Chitinivibrionales bacterium]|nr:histidinol dehydrogenase [Chitinivibrionales bacterium]
MRRIDAKYLPQNFFKPQPLTALPSVEVFCTAVANHGDSAVRDYCERFDGVSIEELRVSEQERRAAGQSVSPAVAAAIEHAAANIRTFAALQCKQIQSFEHEIEPGVYVSSIVRPLHRVGLYVPAGRYPLVSTVLMTAIPALVAGVEELCLCSPPSSSGTIHPMICAACDCIGIREIYRIGGAAAIAAMAYGTESVPAVDMIVGPGNRYVTAAKKYVSDFVKIDCLAGPTELLIVADERADAEIIAADLISQAEHDVDASVLLVTWSQRLLSAVETAVACRLESLPTAAVARQALEKSGLLILVESLSDAVTFANSKASEHLALHFVDSADAASRFTNYGTLFIGAPSAVAFGDYCSGLNHTLPTNQTARFRGGLSVCDFLKIQTRLRMDDRGIDRLATTARTLADVEGLAGHSACITVRREKGGR